MILKKYIPVALVLGTFIVPIASQASGLPYLLLNMYNGQPNSHIDVSGAGFAPNEQVHVSLGSSTAEGHTDANGNFSGTPLNIPSLPSGMTTIHATTDTAGETASADFYVAGYYPNAEPTAYYFLPGQMISWRGNGFAPNERVTIAGPGGTIGSFTADGGGSFGDQGRIAVPFAWQGSTQTFTVTGSTSGYSRQYQIVVGGFYANVEPSSYYVSKGQGMSASLRDFAPNEQVSISVNGVVVTTATVDGGGNAVVGFSAPAAGQTFELVARGLGSGVTSSRTVTLVQQY